MTPTDSNPAERPHGNYSLQVKGIEMKKQPVPSPGQQLVASVLAQMAEDDLVPDARDLALLDTSAQLADRMADLQALIAADGKRSISETGIVRLHPGIAEYRQHSIALAKVLAAVALVETNGASRKDPAKVRAAETRWRAHNVAKVQGTA